MKERIKEVARKVIASNLPPYTTMEKHGFNKGEDMVIFWQCVKEIDDEIENVPYRRSEAVQ